MDTLINETRLISRMCLVTQKIYGRIEIEPSAFLKNKKFSFMKFEKYGGRFSNVLETFQISPILIKLPCRSWQARLTFMKIGSTNSKKKKKTFQWLSFLNQQSLELNRLWRLEARLNFRINDWSGRPFLTEKENKWELP